MILELILCLVHINLILFSNAFFTSGDFEASIDCQLGFVLQSKTSSWRIELSLQTNGTCTNTTNGRKLKEMNEFLIKRQNGIEHLIRINNGPKEGEIKLVFDIKTNKIDQIEMNDGKTLRFHSGQNIIEYSKLVVTDNKNKTLESEMKLVVKKKVSQLKFIIHEIGEYPILIDPLAATQYPIGTINEADENVQILDGISLVHPTNSRYLDGEEFGYRVEFGDIHGDKNKELIVGAPTWQPETRNFFKTNYFSNYKHACHFQGRLLGFVYENGKFSSIPLQLSEKRKTKIAELKDLPNFFSTFNSPFNGKEFTVSEVFVNNKQKDVLVHISSNGNFLQRIEKGEENETVEKTGENVKSDNSQMSPIFVNDCFVSGSRNFQSGSLFSGKTLLRDKHTFTLPVVEKKTLIGYETSGNIHMAKWLGKFSRSIGNDRMFICDNAASSLPISSKKVDIFGYCGVYQVESTCTINKILWKVFGDQFDGKFGFASAFGNFNNDEYLDVIISQPGYSGTGTYPDAGRVLFYSGKANTVFSLSPDDIIVGSSSKGYFGHSLSNIGDINFDGLDDIAIGSPFANDHDGEVNIYLSTGATEGKSFVHHQTIKGIRNSKELFGFSMSPKGVDLNADGIFDIAIGAPGFDNRRGRVYVVQGIPFGKVSIEILSNSYNYSIQDDIEFQVKIHCSSVLDCNQLSVQLDFPLIELLDVPNECTKKTKLCSVLLKKDQQVSLLFRYSLSKSIQNYPNEIFVKATIQSNNIILSDESTTAVFFLMNAVLLTFSQNEAVLSNVNGQTTITRGDEIILKVPSLIVKEGIAFNVKYILSYQRDIYFKSMRDPNERMFVCNTINQETSECIHRGSTMTNNSVFTNDFIPELEIVFKTTATIAKTFIFSIVANSMTQISTSRSKNQIKSNEVKVNERAVIYPDVIVHSPIIKYQEFCGNGEIPAGSSLLYTFILKNTKPTSTGSSLLTLTYSQNFEFIGCSVSVNENRENCTSNPSERTLSYSISDIPYNAFVFVDLFGKVSEVPDDTRILGIVSLIASVMDDDNELNNQNASNEYKICEGIKLRANVIDKSLSKIPGTSFNYFSSETKVVREIRIENKGLAILQSHKIVLRSVLFQTENTIELFNEVSGWTLNSKKNELSKIVHSLPLNGLSVKIESVLNTNELRPTESVDVQFSVLVDDKELTSLTNTFYVGINLYVSSNVVPKITTGEFKTLEFYIRNDAYSNAEKVLVKIVFPTEKVEIGETSECSDVEVENNETTILCTITNGIPGKSAKNLKIPFKTSFNNFMTIIGTIVETSPSDTKSFGNVRKKSASWTVECINSYEFDVHLRKQQVDYENAIPLPVQYAAIGKNISFVASVANIGKITANDNIVTITWPSQYLTFLSADSVQCNQNSISISSSVFSCQTKDLAEGNYFNMFLTLIVNESIDENSQFSITATAVSSTPTNSENLDYSSSLNMIAINPFVKNKLILSNLLVEYTPRFESSLTFWIEGSGISASQNVVFVFKGFAKIFSFKKTGDYVKFNCIEKSNDEIYCDSLPDVWPSVEHLKFQLDFVTKETSSLQEFILVSEVHNLNETIPDMSTENIVVRVVTLIPNQTSQSNSKKNLIILFIVSVLVIYALVNLIIVSANSIFFKRNRPPKEFIESEEVMVLEE